MKVKKKEESKSLKVNKTVKTKTKKQIIDKDKQVKKTADSKITKAKKDIKEKTKKARITKEYNNLKKLFSSKSEDKKHVIEKLSYRAAFLLVLSEDMEKDIQNTDLTVETINASQSFIKANPLLKDYRDTIKSYQTVIKQLCDLVKNESNSDKDEPDELEMFLNR